ncbi:hypothetical protein [Alloscardovia sp. HMSC034E08]|uniref:hypothetical protein n=1 Tax=Alloscardovia sp. HMSC034E08 TaxID=1739413 RepID=UPI0008B431C1|nr:hypothetical protein [Alloscardovia sp. HMSC034E08]OFQ97628.1 hypothetical protein HMPREF2909_02805 [Alloscardovia sp. HMSC034E08]
MNNIEANNTEDKKVNTQSKRWLVWLVGVLSVVLIVGVCVGVVAWVHAGKQADCHSSSSLYSRAWSGFEKVKVHADETAQVVTSPEQVKNADTFTTFMSVYKKQPSRLKLSDCVIAWQDTFTASTHRVDKAQADLVAYTRELDKALNAVVKSKSEKDVDNAKNMVQSKLDEMNSLLASSDGQVADNSTRDNLQNTINAVKNALNDKNATVESLKKVVEPVQAAIDQVNASMQAKKDADAQAAAAQAAQAQAQAQAQSRSGSRSYSGGGTRSYSAPRSNSGNTGGNTSGGSSSSGSDFDWRSALANIPPGSCEAQGTCQYIIG